MNQETREIYGLRQLESGEWVRIVINPRYPYGPPTITVALTPAELDQLAGADSTDKPWWMAAGNGAR